nr:unnamed protein product [Spirometra erinaceieuropaei]
MCPSNDDEALRYRSGLEGENRCMNQTDCLNVEADCVTCLNSVQRVAGWMNSTYLRWVTKIFIHSLCRVSGSSVIQLDEIKQLGCNEAVPRRWNALLVLFEALTTVIPSDIIGEFVAFD